MARQLGFGAKDVVLLVNHLEDAGPAVRAADPRDRRKNAVTVTPAGVGTLERCAERANAELMGPLSEAEGRQLMELLTRESGALSPGTENADTIGEDRYDEHFGARG
ncbi:hypothetical protein [Streptomyces cyslabdanicus]|uniref:hypothetical protein n=1 Tax=Streptomyces cyslabdanicus TaxID=1470456 RepID=UPI00404422F5